MSTPAPTELIDLTITAAADGMAKGDFSSEELTQAHLGAMEIAAGICVYTNGNVTVESL